MRTDVKVGVTGGLILVSLAVIYMAFFTGGRPAVTEDDADRVPEKIGKPNLLVDLDATGSSDPADDSVADDDPIATIVPGSDATIWRPDPQDGVDADATLVADDDDGTIVPTVADQPDATLTLIPRIDDSPEVAPWRSDPVTPVIPIAAYDDDNLVDDGVEIVAIPGDPSADDTSWGGPIEAAIVNDTVYVVQANDTLWDIAKAKYRQGKYWQHIAKANPGIDPSRLREGMKLKVPPLPARSSTYAVDAAGQEGRLLPGVGGGKIYIVKKGDNGFWAIAAKREVYGDGKYWDLIKRANPGVVPESLRPGQKLNIPARGAVGGGTRTIATIAAVAKRPTLTEPGAYIVQNGDTGGFSAIAKKVYQDGTLWAAIQQANPSVDTRRLRVGQKLIIPSLNKARAAAPSSTRTAGAVRSAAGTTETGSSNRSPATVTDFD